MAMAMAARDTCIANVHPLISPTSANTPHVFVLFRSLSFEQFNSSEEGGCVSLALCMGSCKEASSWRLWTECSQFARCF